MLARVWSGDSQQGEQVQCQEQKKMTNQVRCSTPTEPAWHALRAAAEACKAISVILGTFGVSALTQGILASVGVSKVHSGGPEELWYPALMGNKWCPSVRLLQALFLSREHRLTLRVRSTSILFLAHVVRHPHSASAAPHSGGGGHRVTAFSRKNSSSTRGRLKCR